MTAGKMLASFEIVTLDSGGSTVVAKFEAEDPMEMQILMSALLTSANDLWERMSGLGAPTVVDDPFG